MRIIKIKSSDNGGHLNQNINGIFKKIPEDWAVVPDSMETPNFPFGEVEVSEINGVKTVTKWTPGNIPEDTEPKIRYTREDEIEAMLIEQEYRLALMELGVIE